MSPDPLAALRPLHLPEAVSWWPPAPLWWVLATLTLLAIGLALRAVLHRRRRNHYRRAARRELADALRAFRATGEGAILLARASSILRRAALCRYPRPRVAPLQGKEWLVFLNSTGRMTGFTEGAGSALGEEVYAASPSFEAEALTRLCEDWLRRHR